MRAWAGLCLAAVFAGGLWTGEKAMAGELPIMLKGGELKHQRRRHREQGQDPSVMSREVDLPSRGIWFVWLKASAGGEFPAVLSWDLDGEQPLHSSRARAVIQPFQTAQWLCHSAYQGHVGFKMQVNVDKPGKHTLNLKLREGGPVKIDEIALTLYFSALPTPDGKSLDHRDDPGRGRADFPSPVRQVDGFREDFQSPPVKAGGKTYYLDSENGDDGAAGTSEKAAWKTLANVNSRTFRPGDAILFKRGGKWDESLSPKGDGTKADWITIGAYGEGPRPRIRGHVGPGLSLNEQSYWNIQDLSVTTRPDGHRGAGGIAVIAGKGPQPKGIKITNCVAFDTAGDGIRVGSEWEKGEGYDGVVIDNCLSFAHDGDGIVVNGTKQDGCRNSVIRNCTVHSCDGMAGIWIQSGQNGLIEHCVAYNNAVYNIWTWNSINVTIRYCEAFRGRPPGAYDDSGGFDIDWGCQACTIEYCYAHHNKGAGVLLMGSGHDEYLGYPKETRYTICRYNVFERNGYGILIYNTFERGLVYNNVSVSHDPARAALGLWGHAGNAEWEGEFAKDNRILNNILVGVEGAHPLAADKGVAGGGNILDYNLYWRADGKKTLIRWGGERDDWDNENPDAWEGKRGAKPPGTVFTDFDAFRAATGQEAHGRHARPGLIGAAKGGDGRLPLEEYRLEEDSPARGAGARVALEPEWLAERRKCLTDTGAAEFGIPMDPEEAARDYWGEKLDGAVSIGAQR